MSPLCCRWHDDTTLRTTMLAGCGARVRKMPKRAGQHKRACWRWRWDLNPRRSCPLTRFRGVLLRPLGHATAEERTGSASRAPNAPEVSAAPVGQVRDRLRIEPLPLEERAEQRRGLLLEDAADDLHPMVEPGVANGVPHGAGGARLGVPGTEDEAGDAGQHEGSGAHRARFEGDDEGAPVEAPRPERVARSPEGEDLGVPGRV